VGTVLNRVPASEGYAGQTYQYDTYRSRSERRRKRERDSRTPKAAHLTGNGAGAGPGTKPVQDAPDPTA
jgi:hypothetical protein